ncbi:MAG: hypothetical protein HF981_25990 [Desulfobacteraceae bacterium]|nr:hypothetical protein [Desulfobacteraceae bacterium]MBC2753871.1 hypothetical protein [Desulfobacteraceae bacterium]
MKQKVTLVLTYMLLLFDVVYSTIALFRSETDGVKAFWAPSEYASIMVALTWAFFIFTGIVFPLFVGFLVWKKKSSSIIWVRIYCAVSLFWVLGLIVNLLVSGFDLTLLKISLANPKLMIETALIVSVLALFNKLTLRHYLSTQQEKSCNKRLHEDTPPVGSADE